MIDHLIITVKSCLSFKDIGLLEKLEQCTKWIPQLEFIERIRIEEKKIRLEAITVERKKTLKKRNVEIAKEMKKNGESIEKII